MERKNRKILLAAVLLLAAVILGTLRFLPGMRRDLLKESKAAVRDAVIRSAVECYAVEGSYPTTLAYLEDHYGLLVNHADFIVSYDVFAGNMMPDVRVLVRGEG